jgi:hypothetical protein
VFDGRSAGMRRILGCMALTAALAACGSQSETAPRTQPSSVAPTAASQNAGAAAPTPQPQSGHPTNTHPGKCKAADLSVSLGDKQGYDDSTGTFTRLLILTNTSGRVCTIESYPGVSYVSGPNSSGSQIGDSAFRPGGTRKQYTLRKGQEVSASVGFADVSRLEPATCQPTPVWGLRVIPPDDTESLYLPFTEFKGCANDKMPGHQLTVGMVDSGPGDN